MEPPVQLGYSEEGEELDIEGTYLAAAVRDRTDNFDNNLDLMII